MKKAILVLSLLLLLISCVSGYEMYPRLNDSEVGTFEAYIPDTPGDTGDTYAWYVDGVLETETTNTLSTTFDGHGQHVVFCNIVFWNSTEVDQYWYPYVRQAYATSSEKIDSLDETNYNNMIESMEDEDWEEMLSNTVYPFSEYGKIAFLILYGLIFVMIWIRQESVSGPSVLALIIGSVIIGSIPESYTKYIILVIAIGFAGNLLLLFKDR